MAGYTRNNSNIATGNVIQASDLNGEFDDVVSAFNATSGHTHDGTSAEGAPITKVGPAQNITVNATNITPSLHNTVDIGTTSLRYKDAYFQGSVTTAGSFVGNLTGTATGLANVTSTATELNLLDGVTATTAEINYLDGVTSSIQNQIDSITSSGGTTLGSLGITATASELNIMDGVTATTAELNYVDGVTSAIQTQLDAKQATLTSTSNGYGTRTVSTSDPSGGSDGDIWYKVSS